MRGTIVGPVWPCRWMIRRDLPLVVGWERGPDAWSEADYVRALKCRNVVGVVAEEARWGGDVAGVLVYEWHRNRMDVLRLVVDPARVRQGVGRSLLGRFREKLVARIRPVGVAVVGQGELGAHLFLRACGWRCVGADHSRDTYRFEVRP